MLANIAGGPVGKDGLPPRKTRGRGGCVRISVAQTEFVDLVAGRLPLLRQFEPNTRRAQTWIPRKIDDCQDTERFAHHLNLRCASVVQNLCRTGLTKWRFTSILFATNFGRR